MRTIRIKTDKVSVTATLADNSTADAIWKALPIQAEASTWGDEIYFGIPVTQEQDPRASDVVEMGDLAYWPPGRAFCIFFGPTPASREKEIRAASAVNVFGSIEGPPEVFKQVHSGETIHIEKA